MSQRDERGRVTMSGVVVAAGFLTAAGLGLNALANSDAFDSTTGVPAGNRSASEDPSESATPSPEPSETAKPKADKADKDDKTKNIADIPRWPSKNHVIKFKDENKSALLLNELLRQSGCAQVINGKMDDLNQRQLYRFQKNAKIADDELGYLYGKSAYRYTTAGAKTGYALKWLALNKDDTCGESFAPANRTPGCKNSAGGAPVLGPAVPGTVCKDKTVPNPDMTLDPGCPGSRISNFPVKVYCEPADGHKGGYYQSGKFVGTK